MNRLPYLIAFIVSMSVHFAVFSGWQTFPLYRPHHPVQVQERPKIRMRFVESQKQEEIEPDQPTENISDASNKAAQPEPSEKLAERSDAPAIDKISDTQQTASAPPSGAQSPMPPGMTQAQTAQAPALAEPNDNASNEDIPEPEAKEEEQKAPDMPKPEPTLAKAEIEIPEPKKEDIATRQEKIMPTPKPEVMDIPSGGPQAASPADPLDAKIDELIHNAESDIDSVAELINQLQFNIRKHSLGPYYAEMKRKIGRNWRFRMRHYSTEMFSSVAIVVFKVDEHGGLKAVECVYQNGNPFFSQDCIAAIQASAQFEPLPEDYINQSGKKELWVYATFGYNVE
ncbi:MAG: TonB C-terminal domain-containing protein [Candidatus Auribacterota bacterium]